MQETRAAAAKPGSLVPMTARGTSQQQYYRTYREGLQFMRDRVAEVGDELDRVLCRYHGTEDVSEDLFARHLQACDAHFLRANAQLRKRSVALHVIDSETRLVSLLNQLREEEEEDGRGPGDPETVQRLTEYWDSVKDAVEGLGAVVNKFQTDVLNRLKKNYISDYDPATTTAGSGSTTSSSSGGGVVWGDMAGLEVCSSFTADVSTHMAELESALNTTRILLKSFHSGVYQNLFQPSQFADLLLVTCDLKAFPLLRLVGDCADKVRDMCEVALRWLSRDERFILDVHSNIRQARQRTKRREEDLRSEKEKQKKYEKSMKAAHILLQNNRDKLSRIETELRVLEGQVNESERDKQHRYGQLQQKETMVTFLQITQTQTKRNYNLQATRVKLARQAKDLKELLSAMEKDLDSIQTEIHVKAEEKVRLSEKVEHHLRSYDTLRGDMDRFSSRMEHLESEVTQLSGQLLQLEMIHNIKTSPETVEEIYDRPSTVKLAPSLKEKIKERKRKLKPK